MSETVKWIVGVTATIVMVFVIGQVVLNYRQTYEAPNRALDRKIYQESPSYVEGKINAISGYKLSYDRTTDSAAKKAFADIAVREASTISHDKLPKDLRDWVEGLK